MHQHAATKRLTPTRRKGRRQKNGGQKNAPQKPAVLPYFCSSYFCRQLCEDPAAPVPPRLCMRIVCPVWTAKNTFPRTNCDTSPFRRGIRPCEKALLASISGKSGRKRPKNAEKRGKTAEKDPFLRMIGEPQSISHEEHKEHKEIMIGPMGGFDCSGGSHVRRPRFSLCPSCPWWLMSLLFMPASG